MVKLPEIFFNGEGNAAEQPQEEQSGGAVFRPLTNKEIETIRIKVEKLEAETAKLKADLEKEKRDYIQSRKNYSALCVDRQEYIKRSELRRSAIIKGMNSGQAVESLFLEACKAISEMTGDTVIYDYARRYIEALGEG